MAALASRVLELEGSIMTQSRVPAARRLSTAADETAAVEMLQKVFTSAYPYGRPFHEDVLGRLVLAPVLDQLTRPQFEAIGRAAKSVGDTWFYFALVAEGTVEEEQHWPQVNLSHLCAIPFADYISYEGTPLMGTSALWSPSGRWGMLVTHDDFAIAGGTSQFMRQLVSAYPRNDPSARRDVPPEDQVELLLEDVATWQDKEWLEEFLPHIFGVERASALRSRYFPSSP